MTRRSREDQLTAAYTTLHTKLSEIFYNEDPDGMGVTVGAPDDEYAPEASKLIPRLQGARDRGGVEKVVREMFPTAKEALIDQVFEVWERFRFETDTKSET